jgi:uncharacterized membrane protein YcaP (DUF421 family)
MGPDEIAITDLARIFRGQNPWSFLGECAIRILFLYLLIILSMRLMGRRMAGQLSRIEMAALVSLAAAVGVPVQTPERGLLPALIIAAVVVAVQRLISLWSAKSRRFECIVQGDLDILVEAGQIRWSSMEHVVLDKELLFSELRSQGIENLGRVERVYLEANGAFAILQYSEPRAGLSIIPDWDREFRDQQKPANEQLACTRCGSLQPHKIASASRCADCGGRSFAAAVFT